MILMLIAWGAIFVGVFWAHFLSDLPPVRNFLAAAPTMLACRLMGKKYIIRTGGDLLWEWYVERTGEAILLRDFYSRPRALSLKEKAIESFSRRAFAGASAPVSADAEAA